MLQITYRHMSASDALRSLSQELLDKLHPHAHGAERCHLVIDCTGASHGRAARFSAHIDVSFGFADSLLHATSLHDDAPTAIREAFAHIERQIVDQRHRRGDPHAHAAAREGF